MAAQDERSGRGMRCIPYQASPVRTVTVLNREKRGSVSSASSLAALRNLYAWFVRHESQGGAAAFEAMLDFLADALRIHALPEARRHEALLGEPVELAKAWVHAWLLNLRVEDDLGSVLEVDAAATVASRGQFLTPMNVVRMMVEMKLGLGPPEKEGVVRLLDPASGTGRFMMVAMECAASFDEGRFVYHAVDVDLRMVRCTILNLYLTNAWRRLQRKPPAPFRVAWGDFLVVDFLQATAWAHANQWDPTHWSGLPAMSAPPVKGYFEVEAPAQRPTVLEVQARKAPGASASGMREGRQATFDLFGGGA